MKDKIKGNKCYVYVLVDPIKTKIRYVGITQTSLKRRLQSHISEAKCNVGKNTYKNNWIKSLLKINSKPYIKKLISFKTRVEASNLETQLINKYKIKHSLVNAIVDEGKFTSKGKKSAKNLKSKKVYVYNYSGIYLKEYNSIKECAKKENIYYSTICRCLSKEYKYAKNLQFSLIKENKMPDLTNYSKGNWFEVKLLDTETNKIHIFPNRKKAIEFLNVIVKGSNMRDFLGAINLNFGNKYKVWKDNKWIKSTYYNTGVRIIFVNNKTLFFNTKKELGKIVGLKGGFTTKQLEKNIHKNYTNIKLIEYKCPLLK